MTSRGAGWLGLQLTLTYHDAQSPLDGYRFVIPVLYNIVDNQTTVVEQVIVDAAMMMHAKVRHVGEGVWLVASTGAWRGRGGVIDGGSVAYSCKQVSFQC